jgi:hypothetical protein
LGQAGTEIFFQTGLDCWNQLDPVQQIAPSRTMVRGDFVLAERPKALLAAIEVVRWRLRYVIANLGKVRVALE